MQHFNIGGELPVNRLGFGAMRITGQGIWGDPPDRETAKQVLRRAVELGIDLIDTADAYGPHISEQLIAEALHPYPDGLVIATKGGLLRDGPGKWRPDCSPEHLREACEGSLKRLKVDRIDLYQLHTVDDNVPLGESLGALIDLQQEGKIRDIGVCNVNCQQLKEALVLTSVATVQNRYNIAERDSADVLADCERARIGFIPWFPLMAGKLSGQLASGDRPISEIAASHGATPAQVALAWLLTESPMMLPIPGTGSIEHLEENWGSWQVRLSEDDVRRLEKAAVPRNL